MGRPKALLEYGGRTFIAKVCDALRLAGVEERIVVLGRAEREILAAWKPLGEKVVINPRPEDGQLSSLRIGIEAAASDPDGFIICLVDQPTIAQRTYKEVIAFWSRHKDSIVIPRCRRKQSERIADRGEGLGDDGQGSSDNSYTLSPIRSTLPAFKRGHPIIIPAAYRHLCFEGPLEKGLHWVTHHPSVKVFDLTVDDTGIIRDFDTPEDYTKLVTGNQ